jgi:NAD(P)-dependent dehydrogenase (short-subunit alcohol dehydrogenase family)
MTRQNIKTMTVEQRSGQGGNFIKLHTNNWQVTMEAFAKKGAEMIGLKDKVAIVTGGSSGIGAAIAHRLIDEGMLVVVVGRNEERTKQVCATSSAPECALPVLGDIRHIVDCDRIIQTAIERHGRIDVLVNCAGAYVYKPFLEVTEEEIDLLIDTNLKGACFTTQAALRYMIPNHHGVIINITSTAGHIGILKEQVYCSSKGGLVLLTRALAKEFGKDGIRFVNVSPAVIESPMTDYWANSEPDPVAFRKSWEEQYPLRRFGRPEEVAGIVAFLASDEAGWVTGCTWLVDGGILA